MRQSMSFSSSTYLANDLGQFCKIRLRIVKLEIVIKIQGIVLPGIW